MKKISKIPAFIILIFLTASSCHMKEASDELNKNNDLKEYGLHGHVRSIKYSYKSPRFDSDKISFYDSPCYGSFSFIILFNQEGNTKKETSYNEYDEMISKSIYYYYQNTSIMFLYDSNNKLKGKRKFVYNDKHQIVNRIVYHADTVLYNYIVEYSETDTSLIENILSPDGNNTGYKLYEYDENKNIVCEKEILNPDRLLKQKNFFYNDNVLVEEQHFTSLKDSLVLNKKIFYNENGDEIKEEENRISYTSHTNYKYKYDRHNNWIIQDKYIDDKLNLRIIRDIEYY